MGEDRLEGPKDVDTRPRAAAATGRPECPSLFVGKKKVKGSETKDEEEEATLKKWGGGTTKISG